MLTFKIDQEFADVLPTSEQRYKDLEAAVLKDGCFTDPFITWNGFIIDGHTRYKIMQAHPEIDLKPYEKKMDAELSDRYAVIVWIATHQLSRRNLDLNGFEWAEVHKKAFDAEKMQAKFHGNQHTKSGEFESELSKTDDEPRSHAGETATVLAEKFGMKSASAFKHSVRTANAMDEGEKIVPGFKDALKSGTITPSKDSVESILNIKDEEERKEYVTAIANGEKPTNPRKAKETKPVDSDYTATRKLFADIRKTSADMANAESTKYTQSDLVSELRVIRDEFIGKVKQTLKIRKSVIGDGEKVLEVLASCERKIIEIEEQIGGNS